MKKYFLIFLFFITVISFTLLNCGGSDDSNTPTVTARKDLIAGNYIAFQIRPFDNLSKVIVERVYDTFNSDETAQIINIGRDTNNDTYYNNWSGSFPSSWNSSEGKMEDINDSYYMYVNANNNAFIDIDFTDDAYTPTADKTQIGFHAKYSSGKTLSSLNGTYIGASIFFDSSLSKVEVSWDTIIFNGNGNFSMNYEYISTIGNPKTLKSLTGTYSVSDTGLITITASGNSTYAYLNENSQLIVRANIPDLSSGDYLESCCWVKMGSNMSNSKFNGTYKGIGIATFSGTPPTTMEVIKGTIIADGSTFSDTEIYKRTSGVWGTYTSNGAINLASNGYISSGTEKAIISENGAYLVSADMDLPNQNDINIKIFIRTE